MIIESLENKKVKTWSKLLQKKYRDDTNLFLVEGEHLIIEAYKAGYLEELILEKNTTLQISVDTYYVTPEIIKKISSLDTPSSMIGVCKKKDTDIFGNKILILDNIQDPGNLGTMIRSAVAFSFDTIILSHDSVDLYNPKVIRATQGMLFHLNIFRDDLKKRIPILKNKGYTIYGTNVENGISVKQILPDSKLCVVLGNEGRGVSEYIHELCDKNIYIPMNKVCESLNVGVAASIIMYEFGKERR